MRFSVIVPSYNQREFIGQTLSSLIDLKKMAGARGIGFEILLFDSESEPGVQEIIDQYRTEIDHVQVKKDKGQYDAINQGISRCTGDYWTWLNTDDLLDPEGFLKMAEILDADTSVDYIYGAIDHIDEEGRLMKHLPAYALSREYLVQRVPGIFQQGSFFRKSFTDHIGLLKPYDCCFDYEYVLRCIGAGAKLKMVDFRLGFFRQHNLSKTGSRIPMFIRDQLAISAQYGRKFWHFLTWFSHLRLIKHQLFPRS